MPTELKFALKRNGFVFLKNYKPDLSICEIASELGSPISPLKGPIAQTLTPRRNDTPNTYSGIYGLGQFPFHSDLAHLPAPPRYLMLRCAIGCADVATLLIDGRFIVEVLTESFLTRAIFKPRRPQNGTLRLLSLFERTENNRRLRWDSQFLKPASKLGETAKVRMLQLLPKCQSISVFLSKAKDTLIIDNWRMLHARSPVQAGNENRAIERIYLEGLN